MDKTHSNRDAADYLKAEIETYEKHRSQLVADAEGKFALIHGSEVFGTFDTYEDALGTGYRQYGLEPFMVQQILGVEQVQFLSREIGPCQP